MARKTKAQRDLEAATSKRDRLAERLATIDARLAQLDPAIAAAIADETDASKLRTERERARNERSDLPAALDVAESRVEEATAAIAAQEREKDAAEAAKAEKKVEAELSELRTISAALVERFHAVETAARDHHRIASRADVARTPYTAQSRIAMVWAAEIKARDPKLLIELQRTTTHTPTVQLAREGMENA